MTDTPSTDAIVEALERRLAAWITPQAALRVPDLESAIVRAILSQQSCTDLPHLRREYFSVAQHGWVWELYPQCEDMVDLAKRLIALGYSDATAYIVEHTRSPWEPQTPIDQLVEAAATIRRLWWARQWHRVLTECDLLVCAGAIDHEALLEKLRTIAKETKEVIQCPTLTTS